jgi:acyl-CoA synthetase (AMP-forming)/AMP-acid ligase II
VLRRWGLTPAAVYAVAALLDPLRPAIVDDLGTLTFADVHRRTNSLAHSLRAAGIGEGAGVAMMCRNHRGFLEASIACSKLGANALYLDTGLGAHQVTEAIRREDSAAVVYDQEFTELVQGWRPEGIKHYLAYCDDAYARRAHDPTLEQLSSREPPGRLRPPRRRGTVTIFRPSSDPQTTGSTRSLASTLLPGAPLLSELPFKARETTVLAAPLFHPWGFLHFTLALRLASTLVLRRHVEPEDALRAAARHSASALAVTPAMLQRILELPAKVIARHDLQRLRIIAVCSAALPHELPIHELSRFGTVLYNMRPSTRERCEQAWL